jgi:hypothetical protein
MMAAFPYKKLPGTRRGLIRKAALWEGVDHLLSITGTRFSEQYRRFYYRDIQALVIRKCPRSGSVGIWLFTVLFCVLFAFLGSIFSRLNGAAQSLHFTLWAISAACFLYLVYRLIVSLRYSCRCYVQTAVAWEELPSLYRIGSTQKALIHIRSRITETQGALAEDPQMLTEGSMGRGRMESFSFPQTASVIKEESNGVGGERTFIVGMNLALLGCIALLVMATLLFWHMDAPAQQTRRPVILLANTLVTSVAGISFLFSLLRVYKVRALHPLRNFLLAVLALTGLHVYFSTLLSRIYPQQDPFSIALSSASFRHWFSLIDGSFALLFGLCGVALIVFNWENYSKGVVSNA